MTPQETAEFMLASEGDTKWLSLDNIVMKIRKEYGVKLVFMNENGNWTISKKVLAEFRKLTATSHISERDDRGWRLRTDRHTR